MYLTSNNVFNDICDINEISVVIYLLDISFILQKKKQKLINLLLFAIINYYLRLQRYIGCPKNLGIFVNWRFLR